MSLSADITISTRGRTASLLIAITDADLHQDLVHGTISWGDGLYTTISRTRLTSGSLSLDYSHVFQSGTYTVKVVVENYRSPTPDRVSEIFVVSISDPGTKTVPNSISDSAAIAGPILPRDGGFPNKSQWILNLGEDLLLVESNLRTLLLTSKGERLCDPDFGTNLGRLVFESDVRLVQAMAEDDIISATSTYIPQVSINSINIQRSLSQDLRGQVVIQIDYVAKGLNSRPLQIQFSK